MTLLRPPAHEHWWTGTPEAWLDLLYRVLPEIIGAHVDARRRRPLRLWHVGHEDGSQTMLLAAIVDAAVAWLAARRSKLRSRLERLDVELLATDFAVSLRRNTRTLRFDVEDVPRAEKSPLIIDEFGAAATRSAG